jgi:hypothetical protein
MGADGHIVYIENEEQFVKEVLKEVGVNEKKFEIDEKYHKFVEEMVNYIGYCFISNRDIPFIASENIEDKYEFDYITENYTYAYHDNINRDLDPLICYLENYRYSSEEGLQEYYSEMKLEKFNVSYNDFKEAVDNHIHILNVTSWQMWT